ncbi:hypothetical protein R3P38DRAFT_3339107, partial [Favolaschia claudopus]
HLSLGSALVPSFIYVLILSLPTPFNSSTLYFFTFRLTNPSFDSTRRTRRSYTKRVVDFLDSGIFQVVDSNFKLSFIGIQADFFLFHIESLICIHKTVSGTLYIKLSASIHLFEYRSTVSLQRSRCVCYIYSY